jgi:lysozyme family protein
MVSSTDKVIQSLLLEEGGVADVGDGMGITHFGQTVGWLMRFGFPVPTTTSQAAANYAAWLKLFQFDKVLELNYPLGRAVVDFAVNATESTAIRGLEQALGVAVDRGVIGSQVLGALSALSPVESIRVALRLTIQRQRNFAHQLADPTQWKYAGGWMNRLADIYEELL